MKPDLKLKINHQPMNKINLISEITCPNCGKKTKETMKADSCQFFWECSDCRNVVKPEPGDCCVFCSYGDKPCPPVQEEGKTCC